MLIKTILKGLFKKKLSSILIIIQVAITVIILVYSYDSIRMLDYPQKQMESVLGNEYKNIYQISFNNSSDSQQFADSFSKLDDNLCKYLGSSNIGSYHLTNTEYDELSNNNKFKNLRLKFTKGTFKEQNPSSIELYTVDYSIYKKMNVQIKDGQALKEEDFIYKNNSVIPMVVSEVYKGIINLNQIYTSRLDNRKYKVVGFFNDNLKWFENSYPVYNKLISLNDKIITPYIIEKSGLNQAIKSQSYFFINDKGISDSNVKSNICTLGRKFNLDIECTSLNDQIQQIRTMNKQGIFITTLIAVFFTIVSCLGLSLIMYYSINSKKSEIGIRIVCGGSTKYIKTLIIGEIITLMIPAFLISLIALYKLRGESSIGISTMQLFDLNTTAFIIIFLLVFSILSSILPLRKISKLSPKELIGGKE